MNTLAEPLHAAFLVTDIVGSTVIAERLGDQGWYELLVSHHDAVRDEAERHGGWEVSFLGDGFVLAFDDAENAAHCAVALQRAIHARDTGIRIRIGMHCGPALRHEGSLVGRAIHHACRLAEAAAPGEILLSPLAAGEAGHGTEQVAVALKGSTASRPARRLRWERGDIGAWRRQNGRFTRIARQSVPLTCA